MITFPSYLFDHWNTQSVLVSLKEEIKAIEIRHELMAYAVRTCRLKESSNLKMVANVLLKIRETNTEKINERLIC